MSVLDPKIREMAAVAASVAANCSSCLKYHFVAAVSSGCTRQELAEIIEIAAVVKKRPTGDMTRLAGKLMMKWEIRGSSFHRSNVLKSPNEE